MPQPTSHNPTIASASSAAPAPRSSLEADAQHFERVDILSEEVEIPEPVVAEQISVEPSVTAQEEETVLTNGILGENFASARRLLQARSLRKKKWLYGVVLGAATAWLGLISWWLFSGLLPLNAVGFQGLAAWSLAVSPMLLLAFVAAVALRQVQSQEQSGLFALQLDLLTGGEEGEVRLRSAGALMLNQAEALRRASIEAGRMLQESSASVCLRTAEMKELAEQTQKEAREMMEVTSGMLRERLSGMEDTTRGSLEGMTRVVDRLQDKEKTLAAITSRFDTLKEDMGGLLTTRSGEFVHAMKDEVEKMNESFQAFRDEIASNHSGHLQQLQSGGSEVTERLQQIALDNRERLQDFEQTMKGQHTQMVENFSTGQNSLYTRVRGVLQDITTGVDQLVNRIESRQVQIRETLSEQTKKLQTILSRFNAQHEAEVRQSAQTLIEVGEQVKKRIFEQNSELKGLFVRTLESQRELREAVTERLEQDRELLESVVVEQNDKLHAKLRGNFSHHSEWLNHLVLWLEQQNESLQARSQDYERLFEGLLARTLGALDKSGEEISQRLYSLKDHSDKTGSAMGRLSVSIGTAFATIEKQSTRGLSVAGELSDKITEGAATLDKTTNDLISTGQVLSESLRQQADKICEATSYIRSEQDQAIDAIAEKAILRIESFSSNVQQQTQQLNDALAKRLAEQGDILHQSMAHNLRQFDRLGENLSHALVETNNKIFERLLEQTGTLEKSTTELVGQIAQSTKALDSSIDHMQGAIAGNDSRMQDVKTLAQKQLQYFEALLERIEGSSAQVRARLLGDQRKILLALDGVQTKNVEASGAVVETSEKAVARAEQAGAVLSLVQKSLQGHLAAMSEVSNQARMHVSNLEEKIRAQIAHIGQALEGHNKTLSVAFDPTLRQVGRIIEAMDQQAERLYKGFEESHARVHKTSVLLQQQEVQIQTLFADASATMGKAEQRLLGSAQTIARSATALEQQSRKIAHLLQKQTQAVEQSASGFEGRLKDMGTALLQHLEELRLSGEQFASRFRNTGSDFRSIAQDLEGVLERTVGNLERSGVRFSESSQRLVKGLEHTDRMLVEQRGSSERATLSFSAFGKRAGETLSAVQQGFGDTEKSFDKVAEGIRSNIHSISRAVNDDNRGAAALTEQLGVLRTDLHKQCRALETMTQRALERFEALPSDLERHGKSILARVDSLRSETETLSQTISEDVQKLKRATDPIREDMRNLFSGGLSDKQEAFMKRARAVVDNLHEQSSEIAQHLFDEEEPESRMRFKEGERNAYTKRILQNTTPSLLTKMNEHIEEQPAMGRSVASYQSTFEDLFEGAQNVDPDNLLPMAFMSSDVGKLYLVFARVCGREPIGFERMH